MPMNIFNSIQVKAPRKNVFDLTRSNVGSCNMGQLVPVCVQDCIPGGNYNIGAEIVTRFAPMLAPMFQRVNNTVHYFFIPYRILWPNWDKFITGNQGSPVPAFPTLTIAEDNYTRLSDYLGIPRPSQIATPSPETISAMFHAAYQCVWNEYYRDQNLQSEVPFELGDGDNSANTALFQLRFRAWMHDYLTSALPFAQKGAPVNLPIGQFNDISVKVNQPDPSFVLDATPFPVVVPGEVSPDPIVGDLYADTSDLITQSTTINDLRTAWSIQGWLEKAARAGSRYFEYLKAFFNVNSPDKRLQRPEYITGTKTAISISEVLQTGSTDDVSPQGNMAGHGVGVVDGSKYGTYYAQEHGCIIGIMNIQPTTSYGNGIPKHFLKTTDQFQYFQPELAHLGEQEILNREVFAYKNDTIGDGTWGYTPRYQEYRYANSVVSGDMRTNLKYWTMWREFTDLPPLNEAFIEANPTFRIFAVTDPDIDHIYFHCLTKMRAVLPVPKYGTPSVIM